MVWNLVFNAFGHNFKDMTKEERFEILKALCYSVPQNTNVDPHQISAAIVCTYKGVIECNL